MPPRPRKEGDILQKMTQLFFFDETHSACKVENHRNVIMGFYLRFHGALKTAISQELQTKGMELKHQNPDLKRPNQHLKGLKHMCP